MVSSAPPPPLRDRKLDLDELLRLARSFDAISDEQDARYSARSFVRWLADEYAATARRTGRNEAA